jgi:hypothetical protein
MGAYEEIFCVIQWPYGAPRPSWKCVLLSVSLSYVDCNVGTIMLLKHDAVELWWMGLV